MITVSFFGFFIFSHFHSRYPVTLSDEKEFEEIGKILENFFCLEFKCVVRSWRMGLGYARHVNLLNESNHEHEQYVLREKIS